MDPAGVNRIGEYLAKMTDYNLTIYAIWQEPDFKWEVKFDPNGGNLVDITGTDVATHKEGALIETTQGFMNYKTPRKLDNEGNVNVIEVDNRMSIKEPSRRPTRRG